MLTPKFKTHLKKMYNLKRMFWRMLRWIMWSLRISTLLSLLTS